MSCTAQFDGPPTSWFLIAILIYVPRDCAGEAVKSISVIERGGVGNVVCT
jgi:hypothetical protein